MEENKDLPQTDLQDTKETPKADEGAVTEEKPEANAEGATEEKDESVASNVIDLSQPEEKAPDAIDGEYHPGEDDGKDADAFFKPVAYRFDGTHTIDEDLDSSRKAYVKKTSFSRIFNYVSMAIVLVAFVAILLVAFLVKDESLQWVNWVVIAVCLVAVIGSFVGSMILNKSASKVNIQYLGEYQDKMAGYLARNLDVENPLFSVEAMVQKTDVIQSHYFKTIMDIRSRCVLRGQRKGKDFETGECYVLIPEISIEAANKKPEHFVNLDGTAFVPSDTAGATSTQEIPSNDMTLVDYDLSDQLLKNRKNKAGKAAPKETTTRTGLFGRFYSYALRLDPEQSFILCFAGERANTVLPDYVDSFSPVHVPGLRRDIVVYLANPAASAPFFDEEGVSLLNDIHVDTTVYSLFITGNSYGVRVGMNLSDDIMELPMRNPVHVGAVDDFVEISKKAFAFIDSVEKKATVQNDEKDN